MTQGIRIFLAVFAAGLVALSVVGIRRGNATVPAAPEESRAVRVTAARLAAGDDALQLTGLIAPKDQARLAFKVGGYVESIRVDEGVAVHAGEVLAVLKQTEIAAALDQARQAEAKARRDLDRAQALFADGVTTAEQVDDLTTAYRVATAAARSAAFNAKHAQIRAPADGVVLRKLVDPEEFVQAGQTVLVVGDARGGWVARVGLADRDFVRIKRGDPAQVTFDAWPERRFVGRVTTLASAADPATGTLTAEIKVDNDGAPFVQGLIARVQLPMAATAGAAAAARPFGAALRIPVEALVEANGAEASVFVVDAQCRRAWRKAIQIGPLSGREVSVAAGLDAGARVVVDGAAFLESGGPVHCVARDAAIGREGAA